METTIELRDQIEIEQHLTKEIQMKRQQLVRKRIKQLSLNLTTFQLTDFYPAHHIREAEKIESEIYITLLE